MKQLDPFQVLGIPLEATDEVIRARYLSLIREFSPEHHPEKFSAIRVAYEKIRDLESRVRYRLFERGKQESLDQIAEDIACQLPRPRPSLSDLIRIRRVQ